MDEREQSLEYVSTFCRLARAAISRGGSASFEWPRHCEGWKTQAVMDMIETLGLTQVDVDGCSVGVKSKKGEPILKPWRFAVSSVHLQHALSGLRCDKTHDHVPCAGNETSRTAFYPEELCKAIHKGLDAHDASAQHARHNMTTHINDSYVSNEITCSKEHLNRAAVEPEGPVGVSTDPQGSGEYVNEWELFCLEHGMACHCSGRRRVNGRPQPQAS